MSDATPLYADKKDKSRVSASFVFGGARWYAGVMKHVVMFSGGLGSWAAARRVVDRHGTSDLVLLFTDTRVEDPDLYRFLDEAAANVGGELVRIADGRTLWDVFRDERFLGNSRVDPCSKILKRKMADRWIAEHCDSAEPSPAASPRREDRRLDGRRALEAMNRGALDCASGTAVV